MAKDTSAFLQVVKAFRLTPTPPASGKAIAEFEDKSGLKMPQELREIYQTCDGLKFKESSLEILSLETALTWVEAFRREGIGPAFGYLPFAEANDSNPFCVCCSGPMAGLVVRVFHDDAPQLMFRSADNFFKWILTLQTEEDWRETDELWQGEYSDSQRTKKDLAQAKKIMQWAEELTDTVQTNARRFALTILSEESIDDIIAQLDANDHYVREEAEIRLGNMEHPRAEAALGEYYRRMRDFAKKCIEVLENAGFEAEYIEGKGWPALKVHKGIKSVGLNFPVFYSKRNDMMFGNSSSKLANADSDVGERNADPLGQWPNFLRQDSPP